MIRTLLAAAALVSLSACSSAPEPVAVADAADAAAWAKYVPWNSAAENVVKTGTGVEYIVLATGPADGELPGRNATAQIHYEGRLNAAPDKTFDSSFTRNEVAEFPISLVIPGFEEALNKMRPGRFLVGVHPLQAGLWRRGRRCRHPAQF